MLGVFGVALFGLLFSATFISPKAIEASAKEFVKHQIEKELREKQHGLSETSVAQKAASLAEQLGIESAQIQKNLDDKLPEKIAHVIASMCGYDCERKKLIAQTIATNYFDRIKNIQIAQSTLDALIKNKYLEIISNLKLDLRIFLGSNFFMFLILIALSLAKPQAVTHLFLPGLLLLTATVLASGIYIFGQDWFYTILYNDYMGFGYLAYVSLIFAFLLDITVNKAQVTSAIINGIANVIGSALSVAPC